MSIFTNLETDFEGWWSDHVKPFLSDDIEPTLKAFFQQFAGTFGRQAITAALGAVGALVSGTAFGSVATGLAATLVVDAKSDAASDAAVDATALLQTVQSALQVAKVANNVVTPADQIAAASISTPIPTPTTAPSA